MLPVIAAPIEILQTKTVDELKIIVTADMTKRDLLITANCGTDKVLSDPICAYCRDGQIESQIETIKDVETNALILTRQIIWSYYDTGEVDTITITETDNKGVAIIKIIKHFTDGRQPEVKHDL